MVPEVIRVIDRKSSQDPLEVFRALGGPPQPSSHELIEEFDATDPILKDAIYAAIKEENIAPSPQAERFIAYVTYSLLVDLAAWTICVEKQKELVVTEDQLEKYVLHFIQTKAELAYKNNDKAFFTPGNSLVNMMHGFGVIREIFDPEVADYSNLRSKMLQLAQNLKPLPTGDFQNRDDVYSIIRRIFFLDQGETDPKEQEILSELVYDSSPPMDTTENVENELSNLKDLSGTIVSQSTQIQNTQSMESSVENRVDVEATSSSTDASQMLRTEHELGNGLQESESQEPIDTQISNILASIEDADLRKQLTTLAQDLKAKYPLQNSFIQAYTESKTAFETLQKNYDSFQAVYTNFPIIKSFMENILPSTDENDISIKSSTDSQTKNNDSQSANSQTSGNDQGIRESVRQETAEREEIVRILANYFDKKLANLTEETRQNYKKSFFEYEKLVLGLHCFANRLGSFEQTVISKTEFSNVMRNVDGKLIANLQRSNDLSSRVEMQNQNMNTFLNSHNALIEQHRRLEKAYSSLSSLIDGLTRENQIEKKSIQKDTELKSVKEMLLENVRIANIALDKVGACGNLLDVAHRKIDQLSAKMKFLEEWCNRSDTMLDKLQVENQQLRANLERLGPLEQLSLETRNLDQKISDVQNKLLDDDSSQRQNKADEQLSSLTIQFSQIEENQRLLMEKIHELERKSTMRTVIPARSTNGSGSQSNHRKNTESNNGIPSSTNPKATKKTSSIRTSTNGAIPVVESFGTRISSLLQRGKAPVSNEGHDVSSKKRAFDDSTLGSSSRELVLATENRTTLNSLKKIRLFKDFAKE